MNNQQIKDNFYKMKEEVHYLLPLDLINDMIYDFAQLGHNYSQEYFTSYTFIRKGDLLQGFYKGKQFGSPFDFSKEWRCLTFALPLALPFPFAYFAFALQEGLLVSAEGIPLADQSSKEVPVEKKSRWKITEEE